MACIAPAQRSNSPDACWQRVTAQLNGVFSPRGFFNILVRLYSLPSLESAQFNLRQSSLVMDFPPGAPPITSKQIQRIEKDAGYRPGNVEIQQMPVQKFAENGPGWIKIEHPQSKYAVVRWLKQNF
ncbi:MAG: hypothetical protein ACP5E5_14625 [Acidobacteriaceae bacterium]